MPSLLPFQQPHSKENPKDNALQQDHTFPQPTFEETQLHDGNTREPGSGSGISSLQGVYYPPQARLILETPHLLKLLLEPAHDHRAQVHSERLPARLSGGAVPTLKQLSPRWLTDPGHRPSVGLLQHPPGPWSRHEARHSRRRPSPVASGGRSGPAQAE